MKETLYIYPQDETLLDYKYHFSHNLCVRLYDDLVWVLKDSESAGKVNVSIDFKNSKECENFEKADDILSWLKINGYDNKADEVIAKNLICAVLSDACNFIYHSLDCSKKIKLTVALTLIRKPFLENLLIIEQLLTHEKDFLNRFELESKQFDPGRIKREDKLLLIEKSIGKIDNGAFFSSDLINQLRWDSNNPNSIYANSNMATHLVTNRNASYRTENLNLNFIFSSYRDWENLLQYYYSYVPYLLSYFVECSDNYLLEKEILTLKQFKERKFLRIMGHILNYELSTEKSVNMDFSINDFLHEFHVTCQNCQHENQIFKSDILSLVNNDYIMCKYCLLDLFRETNSMDEIINEII
ncbi:MAG: hypothetical protein ACR2MS_04360 [Weeksellaceae bacterium]